MRITAVLYVLFVLLITSHVPARADDAAVDAPLAQLDLTTQAGIDAVQGAWRYKDVELIPTQHRSPDGQGQPTGAPAVTWDYTPHAGLRDFDDSGWETIDPTAPAAPCTRTLCPAWRRP